MKFQEFLEFFDTGGKISFTYEGKDYEFLYTYGLDKNGLKNERGFIFYGVYCNGKDIFFSLPRGDGQAEFIEFIEFISSFDIDNLSLQMIIEKALYEDDSLITSHDVEITTIGDVLNRVNVGFDFELYYEEYIFYMSKWGGLKKGENNRTFVYYPNECSKKFDKDAMVERMRIAATTEHIDSKHEFIMESENLEEYYFFLKNLKVDGVKFTDIIGNKLYKNYFY